jgi:hypothetical protein
MLSKMLIDSSCLLWRKNSMIFCQGLEEMSQEQLVDLVQMHLVGRWVSIPLKDEREPVPGMHPWPYPSQGRVTALRYELVWGVVVLVEASGFATCCFRATWALEHLAVIGE